MHTFQPPLPPVVTPSTLLLDHGHLCSVSCGCFLPPSAPVINGRADLGPVSSPRFLLLFRDSFSLWLLGDAAAHQPQSCWIVRIDAALCCTSTVLALSFQADWAPAHVWLEGFNIQEEGPAGWGGGSRKQRSLRGCSLATEMGTSNTGDEQRANASRLLMLLLRSIPIN